MTEKILSKDKWSEFLSYLASSNKVWALTGDNPVEYTPYSEGESVNLGVKNSAVPPKSIVFPQTETMFEFKVGETEVELPEKSEEQMVIGLRPCDAKAMSIVDSLFGWDFDDEYYQEKRKKSLLVGMACNEPCINCFCTSVGGGPASTEGLDVLMADLGESYYLVAASDRGKEILAGASVLVDAADGDKKAFEDKAKEAEGSIKRSIDTTGIPEGLPKLWEDALWKEVSAACLGCGTCTYLCPTCHCFDIQDEVEGKDARRCRMWDSCMFEEYTLHTSGHNTRPTRRERTRNRINHKYNYYVSKFDKIACVGCGRCINQCPVNIDILEILSKVKEAL